MGARVRRRRLRRRRRAAGRGRRRLDRAAAGRAGAAGRARRRGGQAPAAGEADRARRRRPPTAWSTPCGTPASRRSSSSRFRFQPATSTWLTQAGPHHARRRARRPGWRRWPGSPFDASPWRKEHGALWDIGPHALSLLVPALGPVVVGAGRRRAPATPCTWCSRHESGAASHGDALAHGGADVGGHRVLRARRRRPARAAARRRASAVEAFTVAVDELTAAALTGGAHPCDVAFGRDVVAVLEAAAAGAGLRLPRAADDAARASRAPRVLLIGSRAEVRAGRIGPAGLAGRSNVTGGPSVVVVPGTATLAPPSTLKRRAPGGGQRTRCRCRCGSRG